MWKKFIFVLCLLLVIKLSVASQANTLKPRIIVLTDVSTWETDDSESLVRLLVYADMFEIEGLVFTTGWSLDSTRKDFFNLIHTAIDAYDKDLPNLCKRSGQTDFSQEGHRQKTGYWPSANYLRTRTVFGSKKRGISFIGKDNDSEGSELIIKLAGENDDRPIWVLGWGGGNTLAQAVWRVQHDKNNLQKFLNKIRFYAITDQDRDQNTPYAISSHQWLRRDFEKSLLFLWDESAWSYQNGTGKREWSQYQTHIQDHGNLGSVYPKYKYGVEGDTPSFLYVLPNGLNVPENPEYGGWGGYFTRDITPDDVTYAYTNHSKLPASKISLKYQSYFYPAIFNDFAARMDWAKDGMGNRNPVIAINRKKDINIIRLTPKQGSSIIIDASASSDPDGNKLSYKWWVLSEAGTYRQAINLDNPDSDKVTVKIPTDSVGRSFHLICEVKDNGIPNLTAYRRIIVEPSQR